MNAVNCQDDRKCSMKDHRVKGVVEKMRDSQFLIESDRKKKFGILP